MEKLAETKRNTVLEGAKSHNLYLDVMKGFTIVLVVLGHSIQRLPSFETNPLFHVIYSFHIPLFMFLCGAVASYSRQPMNWQFIRRKFYILLIPFYAWIILRYFLDRAYQDSSLGHYVWHVIQLPDYGLWFLWILFLIFCCMALAKYLKRWLGNSSYFLVWTATLILPGDKFDFVLLQWHFLFFLAGYVIFLHRAQLQRYGRAAFTICLLTYPFLLLGWRRSTSPVFTSWLSNHLVAHHLSAISFAGFADINLAAGIAQAYNYLVAFTAIGLFGLALTKLPHKRLYRLLAWLGLYTMDIYVLFWYFVRFGFGNYWVQIISSTIIAIVCSLVVSKVVIRPIKWLNLILVGGR